jgi:hypothetical protein
MADAEAARQRHIDQITDAYAFDTPDREGMCEVCGEDFEFRWCDCHGIAACLTCGAPYRLLHYDGDERVEKPPELLLKDGWLEPMQQYWEDAGRNIAPGAFMMGRSAYDPATEEDYRAFDAWCEENQDLLPDGPDVEAPEDG